MVTAEEISGGEPISLRRQVSLGGDCTDEDFSLDDLVQDLRRLEWQALGNVRRGSVPPTAEE